MMMIKVEKYIREQTNKQQNNRTVPWLSFTQVELSLVLHHCDHSVDVSMHT
jgi:hypothetical protein